MTEIRDSYEKRYRMSVLGEGGLKIVVSIPRMVILREAKKCQLTIEEFLEQFKAVAQFNNFEWGHLHVRGNQKRGRSCLIKLKRGVMWKIVMVRWF